MEKDFAQNKQDDNNSCCMEDDLNWQDDMLKDFIDDAVLIINFMLKIHKDTYFFQRLRAKGNNSMQTLSREY